MPRLRDVFPTIGILPTGPHNAITDVSGVRVGHATLAEGAVRTGVTAIFPGTDDPYRDKVIAAAAVLNGYGKSIGVMQIEELGTLETPILLTSTLTVPRVADALLTYLMEGHPEIGGAVLCGHGPRRGHQGMDQRGSGRGIPRIAHPAPNRPDGDEPFVPGGRR